MKYQHVVQAVFGTPWMVRPETLDTIAALVRFRAAGGHLTDAEVRERVDGAADAAGPRRGARTMGAIGVIPIYGLLMPRANLMTEMSGGSTVAGIRDAFRAAMEDESVGSILFDVDSPGGVVDGIEELATEIRDARGRKPIVAIADYSMASAAYYLGAQADEVVASPSARVGWIGTVMAHTEYSKADEIAGITTTVFRNPPGKAGANEFEPLSDKARAELQQAVDDYSAQFVAAVAKGRGVSPATVREDYGQGGGMSAARAKAAGLVDRVESFDATIRRLATGKGPVPRGTSAVAPSAPYTLAGESVADEPAADEIISTLEETDGPPLTGEQDPDDTSGLPPAQITDQEDTELLRMRHRAHTR